jgi:hypothetical protein
MKLRVAGFGGCVLMDLLLPRTDGGVYAQVLGLALGYGAVLWMVRRNRDLVIFVVGLAVFTAGLLGVRALH